MKVLTIIKNIIYLILIAAVATIAVLLVLSSDRSPVDLRSFTVLSGSMEPSLHTGGVVFIRPTDTYTSGDIVTYQVREENITVTHRIIAVKQENGELSFITKGDANEDPDPAPVSRDQIVGKVVFSLPLLGYAVNFAKTKAGFIALIVLPAFLIIVSEVFSIFQEIRQQIKNKKTGEQKNPADTKKVLFLALFIIIVNIGTSNALFNDIESTHASIATTSWGNDNEPPPDDDWDKSSLYFKEEYECQVKENEISVWICNGGDKDMQGTTTWNVYWANNGNPKNGIEIFQTLPELGPLQAGECELLTYDTEGTDGNYMFKAFQRSGHPGTGELWSETCSISGSEIEQPTLPELPTLPEQPTPPELPTQPELPTEPELPLQN